MSLPPGASVYSSGKRGQEPQAWATGGLSQTPAHPAPCQPQQGLSPSPEGVDVTRGCRVEMPPTLRGVLRGGEKCNAFVHFRAAERWVPGVLMGAGLLLPDCNTEASGSAACAGVIF